MRKDGNGKERGRDEKLGKRKRRKKSELEVEGKVGKQEREDGKNEGEQRRKEPAVQ